MCVSLSSETTVWSVYLDGKRVAYGNSNNLLGVRKECRLGVAIPTPGWSKYLMTQVNLWDRVLSSQEIESFAGKCNEGFGNLVSWSDLYDEEEKEKGAYVSPSSCQPEPLSTTATPVTTVSTTTVTTVSTTTPTTKAAGKRSFKRREGLYRPRF